MKLNSANDIQFGLSHAIFAAFVCSVFDLGYTFSIPGALWSMQYTPGGIPLKLK
eukprot:CAMPEP_0117769464 /NCGR_PEP_ID=MMETSP0947-20121206/23044_1 /TAXON_ID=44440 /ORGANISM="Chattonella subsalsa, Strain CCMP2191" /LENGTH=53 /DNA_ID=CAMNT_0005593957 /DNA_START=488 /DNA_END=649 /DNA_ORIENTATION=-